MATEARMSSSWAAKWSLIAVALLVFGGLCLKDALWAYPEHNRMVEAFEQLKLQGLESDWPKVSAENGWPQTDPGQAHTNGDIMTQWIMLAVCAGLGIGGLMMVALTARRKLVADDTHISGPGAERAAYPQITSIDKSQWDKKGIAVVHYQDESGQQHTLKVDDYVFRGAAAVLEEVEMRTGLGDPTP